MKALCFSFSLKHMDSLAYIRLIAPYEQAGITLINGLEKNLRSTNILDDIDVIIFQREIPLNSEDFFNIVKLAREKNRPIVFEIDDFLLELPSSHPDRQTGYLASFLLPMLETILEADLVTVSSPRLYEIFKEIKPQTELLYNYFDDSLWTFNAPKKNTSQNITIGFMGTKSHKADLEYLHPVITNLLDKFPEKIRFHFWGAPPPSDLANRSQVKWTSQFFSTYTDFVKFFQTQTADIFLAPLTNTDFNRCKSSLKFFEYSALGSPGIYSRIDPYVEVINHGQNGLLASSLQEWHDCLVQLIEDSDMRYKMALNAQSTIKKDWLLSQNASRWRDALKKIIRTSNQTSHHRPLRNIMQSIIQQQEEAALIRQKASMEEKEASMEEILGYALSKSWIYTRPIRKLYQKIFFLRGSNVKKNN